MELERNFSEPGEVTKKIFLLGCVEVRTKSWNWKGTFQSLGKSGPSHGILKDKSIRNFDCRSENRRLIHASQSILCRKR